MANCLSLEDFGSCKVDVLL